MKFATSFRFLGYVSVLLLLGGQVLEGQDSGRHEGEADLHKINLFNDFDSYVINFDQTTNNSSSVGNDMGIFFSLVDGQPRLDVDNFITGDVCVFQIGGTAGTGSLAVQSNGVGIGTLDPGNPGLHVFSDGGVNSPFTDASVHIQNTEDTVAAREQLRLTNNGPTRIGMQDTNTGFIWSIITTGDSADNAQFQIRRNGQGTANMAIRASGTFAFAFGGDNNFKIFPGGNAELRGTLTQGSDRNSQKTIQPIDAQEVLTRVLELPISKWTYKSENDTVRHLGPMSQDFHGAFGLGSNDKTISTLDSSGVALAAIQGLHKQVAAKDKKIAQLSAQLKAQANELQAQSELVAELAERLGQLEAMVTPKN